MTPPLVVAYHGLGTVPHAQDPSGMMVPVESFRRQVGRLRARGYTFVNQRRMAEAVAAGAADGLCSLTFDDAPEDNVTTLLPLLDELEVAVTVYACPALLGQAWPEVDAATGIRRCDRDELARIAVHPRVEIGSHTRTHTELDDYDADAAYQELAASKADLEAMFDVEVVSLAYPSCGYSDATPDAARRAGYTSAVTCGQRGSRDSLFEMARASPAPPDGALAFELKTRGLFFAARNLPPVRLARRILRPLRWR